MDMEGMGGIGDEGRMVGLMVGLAVVMEAGGWGGLGAGAAYLAVCAWPVNANFSPSFCSLVLFSVRPAFRFRFFLVGDMDGTVMFPVWQEKPVLFLPPIRKACVGGSPLVVKFLLLGIVSGLTAAGRESGRDCFFFFLFDCLSRGLAGGFGSSSALLPLRCRWPGVWVRPVARRQGGGGEMGRKGMGDCKEAVRLFEEGNRVDLYRDTCIARWLGCVPE